MSRKQKKVWAAIALFCIMAGSIVGTLWWSALVGPIHADVWFAWAGTWIATGTAAGLFMVSSVEVP